MQVIQKSSMRNGGAVQIEDWSNDYDCFAYGSTIAVYVKSNANIGGTFGPKVNETYRFEFQFSDNKDAKNAYISLVNGCKKLKDFTNKLNRPEYKDCI